MSSCSENYAEQSQKATARKRRLMEVACGHEPADLVLKNAHWINVFSSELCEGDIAVAGGVIAGVGGSYSGKEERNLAGKIIVPGLMDGHIHLESSLVSTDEFVRTVIVHGTTTVVTDPHEITNVMGTDGIRYMLEATALRAVRLPHPSLMTAITLLWSERMMRIWHWLPIR